MRPTTNCVAAAAAALTLACGLGGLGGLASTGAAPHAPADGPPGDTVVDVSGDRATGFEVRHYDGSEEHPPTGSEARAECLGYDARVDRIRCRTEVRTWYRDLADLRQALDWAHTR